MKLVLEDWGRLDYDEAHRRQRERLRAAGPRDAAVAFVEHPPVYTIGRFGDSANVLDPSLPLRRVERGGDVTYHGPGQLVGYVFVRMDRPRRTIRGLVAGLEEVLSRAAARFGVVATGRADARGIWVGGRKLASIGLALSRGVTWHGFALNVSTDLAAFDRIHPCGMPGVEMTSLSRELGRTVGLEEAKAAVGAELAAYFEERPRPVAAEM